MRPGKVKLRTNNFSDVKALLVIGNKRIWSKFHNSLEISTFHSSRQTFWSPCIFVLAKIMEYEIHMPTVQDNPRFRSLFTGAWEPNAQGCAFGHPLFEPQLRKVQILRIHILLALE